MAIACPECDNPLDLDMDEMEKGEIITCDECGTELEIVSVDPPEISPVDTLGYDDVVLPRATGQEQVAVDG